MSHNFFHIFEIAATIERLNAGYAVLMSRLSFMEWHELSHHMILQFANGKAYRAVLDAGYVEPGAHTHNSAEDDMIFEERHEGMINDGWMQL